MIELYRKHRPKKLSEVIGQDDVVNCLKDMLTKGTLPHTLMFAGPSGTGKTTLARILKSRLECHDNDFCEVNCAGLEKATEYMRGVQERMSIAPMFGRTRIWYFDEVQSLSRAGFSQQAMLKMLEDTPSHVYFFLATTDPSKLHKAIRTRCTTLTLRTLSPQDMRMMITSVCEKEGEKVSEDLIDKIISVSEGSPREALVQLHKALQTEDDKKRMELVCRSDAEQLTKSLAQLLMGYPRPSWKDVVKVLERLEEAGEEVESVRHQVLGYAKKVLYSNGKSAPYAAAVISAFECEMYNSRYAGLALACYKLLGGK